MLKFTDVASLAEAWIEIRKIICAYPSSCVASLAEAWIEIHQCKAPRRTESSPPSRRRGLK